MQNFVLLILNYYVWLLYCDAQFRGDRPPTPYCVARQVREHRALEGVQGLHHIVHNVVVAPQVVAVQQGNTAVVQYVACCFPGPSQFTLIRC